MVHTVPAAANRVADAVSAVPTNADANRRRLIPLGSKYVGLPGGGGVATPTAVGGLRRGGSSEPNGSGSGSQESDISDSV